VSQYSIYQWKKKFFPLAALAGWPGKASGSAGLPEDVEALQKLVRELGLSGRPKRCYRPQTTDSSHEGPMPPNRLAELPKAPGSFGIEHRAVLILQKITRKWYCGNRMTAHDNKRVRYRQFIEPGIRRK
jgi:hypothetical protein